jgi:hypothetical protein
MFKVVAVILAITIVVLLVLAHVYDVSMDKHHYTCHKGWLYKSVLPTSKVFREANEKCLERKNGQ